MSQKNRKLGRTSDQRRAMLRAMVTYLLETAARGNRAAVRRPDYLLLLARCGKRGAPCKRAYAICSCGTLPCGRAF